MTALLETTATRNLRSYYEKNKEDIKAKARARYYANRDTIKAQTKVYALENKKRVAEYKRTYYERNRETVIKNAKVWKANNPDKTHASNRAYRERNHDKVALSRRRWCEANPEKLKSLRKKNKAVRRARTRIGHDKHQDITAWHNHWKTKTKVKCYWCGRRFRGVDMHMDHVVPLAKGGTHSVSNLVMSCAQCNQRKSAANPEEFNRRSHAPRLFI